MHFLSRLKSAATKSMLFLLLSGVLAPGNVIAACDAQGGATDACSEQVPNISQEFLQQRLNRVITSEPRVGQASNGSAPILVVPAGDAASIGSSLSQWSAFLSQQEAKKIQGIKALAPKGFEVPALASPLNNRVDVWGNTKIEGLSENADLRGYSSHFGMDYEITRDFLLGAMVEFENAQQGAEAWQGKTATGAAYLVGPYIAFQLGNNLKFDARAGWGQGSDTISGDGISNSFATERSLAKARIKGKWHLQEWQFSPTAALTYATENPAGGAGSNVTKNSLSVGPELRRSVRLKDGKVIEPFINYSSALDIGAYEGSPDDGGLNFQGTLGGGISLTKKGEYTIQMTIQSEGAEVTGDTKSQLKITIPLN